MPSSSSAVILLEGELRKAYEDFVLGKGSLSEQQIEKLGKVTHLPDHFINGNISDAYCCCCCFHAEYERFKNITSVDLSMFVSVVQIGDWFMYCCSALTSVDLSALTSLSIIGHSFLWGCSAVASVTLPRSSKITKIENSFLAYCSSLTTINNMEALSNVTSIGYHFLLGCSSLETVDFRPLSNVKSVGADFLYNCPKLTKKEHLDQVDLTPLLHLSDNDIQVVTKFEGNKNLKVALARVRSEYFGANGPKFVSSSISSPTAASQSSSSVRSAVPRAASEITSLNFTGPLPDTIDVVEMSQQERSESKTNNFSAAQQKPVQKMSAVELCSFLESQGIAPMILSILKDEGVAGAEFMEAEFITENESLFSAIRKTALDGFKKLHAALCSSSSSSGGTGSSAATAASQ